MDPETLKEMQDQQAVMGGGDPMAMLSNLLGGGGSGDAPAPAPASGGGTGTGARPQGAGAVRHRPAAGR